MYSNNSRTKGHEMPIVKVNEPYWDKKTRQWILEYTVRDKNAGDYIQIVKAEALISIDRIIKTIQSKSK